MKRSGIGAIVGLAAASAVWVFEHLSSVPKAINNVVSRRNFVRNATLGAILIILGQLGAGFVRFFWPNKIGAFGSVLTVAASDVPASGAEPFTYTPGKFYLVNLEDSGLIALYWKCTHLGCTVPWVPAENRFHCPCHGSIYFENGVKESGPAPRPLDYFPITVTPTGDVQVNTGKPTTRSDFSPDQTVAYP